MRKYLLAAAAVAAIATPAMARDGAGYVGIEGGILFPRNTNYNVNYNAITTTTSTATPPVVTVVHSTGSFNNAFGIDYKKGVDLDAIAGYDFGMFRLEGELGYKRTKAKSLFVNPALLTVINTGPVSGVTSSSFAINDRTTVLSGMINGLLDFGVAPGVSVYAGGGAGYARVKTLDQHDNAFAWQLIAGASTAISPNVDLGLKYRYFQTGKLHFTGADSFGTAANGTSFSFDQSGKFKSHSLLASLIFNFGSAEAAPPPPPVEVAPPPPPPPPATQTCADGSVIDATAMCPTPPPPPPPPPPPSRGERG